MSDMRWVGSSTPYLVAGQGDAWAKEAGASGRIGSQKVTRVGQVAPPPEVVAALELKPGESAILRRRLIFLDGIPVEIADSYWPSSLAEGTALAEPKRIQGGAVSLLAQMGYSPAAVSEEVSTRPPSDEEREALRLGGDDWVLVLVRTVTGGDGCSYEASVMVTPGRSRRLHYSMRVD